MDRIDIMIVLIIISAATIAIAILWGIVWFDNEGWCQRECGERWELKSKDDISGNIWLKCEKRDVMVKETYQCDDICDEDSWCVLSCRNNKIGVCFARGDQEGYNE